MLVPDASTLLCRNERLGFARPSVLAGTHGPHCFQGTPFLARFVEAYLFCGFIPRRLSLVRQRLLLLALSGGTGCRYSLPPLSGTQKSAATRSLSAGFLLGGSRL